MSLTVRIRSLSVVVSVFLGCSTPMTTYGTVGLLSPDHIHPKVKVLLRDVEGEHCVTDKAKPDFGAAVQSAIAKVPDGNVMSDVSFEYQDRVLKFCAWVKGDVGVLR